LPGGGGLTAPYTRSNRPLWTAGFRVVFAVVGACVLRLLVEFVPRTSSTPMATWFWQTEGRSMERVILGVRPSEFILSKFQYPSRRIFIGSHSLPPPLWSPNRSFNLRERRGARLCGRQAGSGGGADKEEEDGREASMATPPGGDPTKSIPSRCHLLLAAAVDNFKSYSRSAADGWSVLLP
jgi:hypothetical protein